MSDWQERITHETAPTIRVEHELRYRAARPLILAGEPWVDLGCGNGVAPSAALGAERPASTLLVDLAEGAVETAAAELGIAPDHGIAADLTDPDDLDRVRGALLALGASPIVTCFEVVEHLSSFLPLLEWAREMTREHGATFVLSVPNDAFWSIQNPHHQTAWGEGAFAELRRLLPGEHTLLRQVSLVGSAFIGWEREPVAHELIAAAGGPETVASHFIAAFGPMHADLWRGALAVQADQLDQRRWERQRESDVALSFQIADDLRATIEKQEATITKQISELHEQTAQFDAWRAYIHELEGELGRPLSGQGDAAEPVAAREPAEPAGEEHPQPGPGTHPAPPAGQ